MQELLDYDRDNILLFMGFYKYTRRLKADFSLKSSKEDKVIYNSKMYIRYIDKLNEKVVFISENVNMSKGRKVNVYETIDLEDAKYNVIRLKYFERIRETHENVSFSSVRFLLYILGVVFYSLSNLVYFEKQVFIQSLYNYSEFWYDFSTNLVLVFMIYIATDFIFKLYKNSRLKSFTKIKL